VNTVVVCNTPWSWTLVANERPSVLTVVMQWNERSKKCQKSWKLLHSRLPELWKIYWVLTVNGIKGSIALGGHFDDLDWPSKSFAHRKSFQLRFFIQLRHSWHSASRGPCACVKFADFCNSHFCLSFLIMQILFSQRTYRYFCLIDVKSQQRYYLMSAVLTCTVWSRYLLIRLVEFWYYVLWPVCGVVVRQSA